MRELLGHARTAANADLVSARKSGAQCCQDGISRPELARPLNRNGQIVEQYRLSARHRREQSLARKAGWPQPASIEEWQLRLGGAERRVDPLCLLPKASDIVLIHRNLTALLWAFSHGRL